MIVPNFLLAMGLPAWRVFFYLLQLSKCVSYRYIGEALKAAALLTGRNLLA